MDSLIFELQIVFYFQLFLSANVRHTNGTIPKDCRRNNQAKRNTRAGLMKKRAQLIIPELGAVTKRTTLTKRERTEHYKSSDNTFEGLFFSPCENGRGKD